MEALILHSIPAGEKRWFAVQTRFKSEKMAQRQLARKGVQAYLPLMRYTRRYTRKIRHTEIPLISCYVFVKINADDYIRVLETEHVLDFVRFAGQLAPIPEQEIDLMRRIMGENWEVTAERTTFQVGDQVEIAAGNLTGLRGLLVETTDKQQVLIELERLGYTLRISIDPALLSRSHKAGG